MPGPKIFISYSARVPEDLDQAAIDRDEPIDPAIAQPDKKLADLLVNELGKRGFSPWQDHRRLKTGQNWHKEISEALRSCRGAIVLLSDISKTSPYVRHEVSFLSVRRDDEGEAFPFLPIWLGSDIPDDIGEYFHAINLKRFQFEALDYPDTLPIDRLVELLEPATIATNCPTTAKELLEIQLASPKNFGAFDPAALRGVAKLRGWIGEANEDTWGHPQAVPTLFARHLMATPMQDQFKALNELGTLDREERQKFFEMVVPLWIEERAARNFSDFHKSAPTHRAIQVKGRIPNFTPGMLTRRHVINRAWDEQCRLPEFYSHTTTGRVDSLLIQALRSICHQLGNAAAAPFEAIRTKLNSAQGSQEEREAACEPELGSLRTMIAGKKLLEIEVYSVLTGMTPADLEEIKKVRAKLEDVVFIIFSESGDLDIPDCPLFDPALKSGDDPPLPHNLTRHHETKANMVYEIVYSHLYPNRPTNP